MQQEVDMMVPPPVFPLSDTSFTAGLSPKPARPSDGVPTLWWQGSIQALRPGGTSSPLLGCSPPEAEPSPFPWVYHCCSQPV